MTKKLLLSVLMFMPLMASAKIYFDNIYVLWMVHRLFYSNVW